MPDLEAAKALLEHEHGLAVVSTTQADGRVLSSAVNCGIVDDPITAAGGSHDDWDANDRAMTDDARVVALVAPVRILGVAP